MVLSTLYAKYIITLKLQILVDVGILGIMIVIWMLRGSYISSLIVIGVYIIIALSGALLRIIFPKFVHWLGSLFWKLKGYPPDKNTSDDDVTAYYYRIRLLYPTIELLVFVLFIYTVI